MLPEGVPKDVLNLIYALMPGFVAAWIFYGLTAHPQKTPFERTIQALIFTRACRDSFQSERRIRLNGMEPFINGSVTFTCI